MECGDNKTGPFVVSSRLALFYASGESVTRREEAGDLCGQEARGDVKYSWRGLIAVFLQEEGGDLTHPPPLSVGRMKIGLRGMEEEEEEDGHYFKVF